jgi:hypothetical protein
MMAGTEQDRKLSIRGRCPLSFFGPPEVGAWDLCHGEECAWWDDERAMCAVKVLARAAQVKEER